MNKTASTLTISNLAGGDCKTFRWTGDLSSAAIRHADKVSKIFGGPVFSVREAHDQYEQICEDRDAVR